MKFLLTLSLILGTFALLIHAHAQVFIHSEASSHDLSDTHTAPTPLALPLGTSFLEFTVNPFDLDLFSLDVPAGLQLDAVIVRSYSSTPGNLSFIGFQENRTTLSSPPSSIFPDPIQYALFGTVSLSDDLLPHMIGRTHATLSGSLPAGKYAFWINETRDLANAVLEFQSSEAPPIPEPQTSFYLGSALLFTFRRSRRRPSRH